MRGKESKWMLLLIAILIMGLVILYNLRSPNQDNPPGISNDHLTIEEHLYNQTGKDIYQLEIPEIQHNNKLSYYNLDVQNIIEKKIDVMKDQEEYTVSEPLLILNPFGTVTNGLYVYFEAPVEGDVTYSIRTNMNDSNEAFTRTVKDHAEKKGRYEFQLIGLVPGEENAVKVELVSKDGTAINNFDFNIDMPRNESFYPNRVNKNEGTSNETLTDGLYYTLGTDGYNGYAHFFDNEGILRAELKTKDYLVNRFILHNGNLLFAVDKKNIANMNSLGKIESLYKLEDYELHHDFMMGRDGELLVLATKDLPFVVRVEDIVLSINLETGKVEELIDFADILGEYKSLASWTATKYKIIPTQLDWIHLNSIEKVAEGEIVVSSREMSTIIKVKNIYGKPTLDFLIGPEELWEDTSYKNKLLTQIGEFPIQAGQHSLNYSSNEEINEGEYFIEFYNNNYWRVLSRPDFADSIDDSYSSVFESNKYDRSYYYKYLINENKGTFELVDSFPVPYSSIVSNVQPLDRNFIINSGMANVVGEYDSNGKVIAEFNYTSTRFVYRVLKDDFNGFWFDM